MILLVFTSLVRTHATVTGYIDPTDRRRFLEILVKSLKVQEGDVVSPYYGALGFKLLKEPLVSVLQMDNCDHLQKNFKADSDPETTFYALSAFSVLECKGKLHNEAVVAGLKAVLDNEKATAAELRYALEALGVIGHTPPTPAKIGLFLQNRLKEDDSLQNIGHALHASTFLGPFGKFALDRVEDVVVQADEVDGRLLQWEGGLTTTSLLITGLLRLQNAKPFAQEQADKFAAYLLTRKSVQTPKGILALLQAVTALTKSNLSSVCITFIGSSQVSTDNPELRIRISDLLGQPLKVPPSPVVAQSATRLIDDVVVLSKQPLTRGKESTEFILLLRLEPGQYKISLTAGTQTAILTARVSGPVTVNWLEIGVGDADSTTLPKLTRLQYPSKLPSILQADSSHQLLVRISLDRVVHQAFLRLYSGKREIIFVAELDSSKTYKIEVNLAQELGYSGTFDLELIVGDSVVSNPIRWKLGSLEAKLGVAEPQKRPSKGPKPEIKHLFRPAEKRPPHSVSMFFTALAAAPLLLLLILWFKVGINFGNFTLLAVPFHLGLGAILGLFTLFWLKLDMFTTCYWLVPIGGFTFLAGHKLLSHIANQKK